MCLFALLHRDSLCPNEGEGLLDTLDTESQKHEAGVSENLKYALREAIELLGNEAARQLIENHRFHYVSRTRQLDAVKLGTECVRLVYRLLFLFYIEARPELGYVPINKSDVYARGYSLESLRNLTLIDLHSPESQNGLYFDKTIKKLFDMLEKGAGLDQDPMRFHASVNVFELVPLDSKLFDSKSTPMLNRVCFPNHLWQSVLKGLSFAKDVKTKRTRRVSYQALSINQLGSVYESLLSYRGFFAQDDLYEVTVPGKKAGQAEIYANPPDLLSAGWFVAKDKISDYKNNEKVAFLNSEKRKQLRTYTKGSFIYRLAGRDKEKSASYYTPHSLTQCVVEYSLKELLKNKTADEILKLRILEPAMGSAAFLNEAVNQLADAYLLRKQQEEKLRISNEQYNQELQKVRMYIADCNVYGVDLNSVATELAEVSLWLNSIYGETDAKGKPKEAHVPWFGYQLFNGNSLIGARSDVFTVGQLNASKKIKNHGGKTVLNPNCYLNAVPRRVPLSESLKDNEIYHFLVPDEGMCVYSSKEVKEYFGEEIEAVRTWKKKFLEPFTEVEIQRLLELSKQIDQLWRQHARQLSQDRQRTEDLVPIWPDKSEAKTTGRTIKEETRKAGMLSEDGDKATPYKRLKLVMDYWCALWFWPLNDTENLPSRTEWIIEVGSILDGSVVDFDHQYSMNLSSPKISSEPQSPPTDGLSGILSDSHVKPERSIPVHGRSLHDIHGELRITRLREQFPRINSVEMLASKFKFFHWELNIADVFMEAGGFDLVLGNPPWLRVEWEEKGILGETDPRIAIRKMSASDLSKGRKELFNDRPDVKMLWLEEYCEVSAVQNFLSCMQNYPFLKGVQTNLYKCFLPLGWRVINQSGVVGFLHPDGVYQDSIGGVLRQEIYRRLRYHFQFQNGMNLFPGIGNGKIYSVNVYGQLVDSPSFQHISNLFSPKTIDACFDDDGAGQIPGIKEEHKDSGGNFKTRWNTRGHAERVIDVRSSELQTS